jgi:hypothetical protein
MKTRMVAVVLCLITVAAFGQSNPKLKELKAFAGTWQCTGTAFASPMGPEHHTTATVHGTWILGGAWMQIQYTEAKTAKNPHPVDVRLFLGYDEQPKAFVSGTVDNMGGYATAQSPGWQNDKMIFSGPSHGGGATMTTRDTFTRVGKNEMRHEGEMEMNGKWMKINQEICKK